MLFQSASAMCSILMPLHIHIYNGIIELRTTDEDQCGLETGKKKNNLCRGPFIVGIFCFFFQALISSTKYKNILIYKSTAAATDLLTLNQSKETLERTVSRAARSLVVKWLGLFSDRCAFSATVRLFDFGQTYNYKQRIPPTSTARCSGFPDGMHAKYLFCFVCLPEYVLQQISFSSLRPSRTFTVQMNGTASDFRRFSFSEFSQKEKVSFE